MTPESAVREIGWVGLALAFLLALAPLWVFRNLRLPLKGQLGVALARMVLQLGAMGLVLEVLFRLDTPPATLGWLLVMQAAAAHAVLRRTALRVRGMAPLLLGVMVLAGGGVLAFCLVAVVRPQPLLEARYLIPLGGMILGNSMNGITLALERHLARLSSAAGRQEWETLLGLGASPEEARRRFSGQDLRVALMPTLNTTATIGLVSLPGMMTGQILGGSPPATAIAYQIVIMLAILAAVSLSAWLAVRALHWRLVDGDGLFREGGPWTSTQA
ncbi:MAG: ABC transporter permease [bacterium]|jgi:putative ABC transport system permease protein|nr:ABC transporter permease [bacterium]